MTILIHFSQVTGRYDRQQPPDKDEKQENLEEIFIGNSVEK